jgi:hypothetical protein
VALLGDLLKKKWLAKKDARRCRKNEDSGGRLREDEGKTKGE